MRTSFQLPTFLVITAWAVPGIAAEVASGLEGVSLEIGGTTVCAAERDLFDRLERHAPKVRRAGHGERARRFRVEFFAQADGGVVARLGVRGLEGEETTRELPARSCDEAAEAAALVIALTLAPSTPPTTPSARSESFPAAAASPAAASLAAASAPAAPQVPESSTAGLPERPDQPPAATSSETSASRPAVASPAPAPPVGYVSGTNRWRPVFAVRATAASGATPAPVMGLMGAVGLVPSHVSAWVPSFEIGLERTAAGRTNVALGTGPVEIGASLTLARAEACLPRKTLGRLSAAACLVGSLGKVDVEASGASLGPAGRAGSAWWSGAGLWGRMQVALGAGFRVELGLGGTIPFWRYSVRLWEPTEGTAAAGATAMSPFRANWVVPGAALGVSWQPSDQESRFGP